MTTIDDIAIVYCGLGANQLAALRALIDDIGLEPYRQSRLLAMVKSRRLEDAADEFLSWIYEDGDESPRLRERREAQQRLFLLEAF